MTLEEFNHEFREVMKAYKSEESYPKARMKIIFKWAVDGKISKNHFKAICEHVIGSVNFTPNLEDFKKAQIATRGHFDSASTLKKEIEELAGCQYCAKEGRFIAVHKLTSALHQFGCPYCKAYELRQFRFLKWCGIEHAEIFAPDFKSSFDSSREPEVINPRLVENIISTTFLNQKEK